MTNLPKLFVRLIRKKGLLLGLKVIARKRLQRLNERTKQGEYVPAAHIARAYMRMGDTDQTFVWLEIAGKERNAFPLLIKSDPLYDALHADARFAAILKKMNL